MRRSTVLSLTLQSVFPAESYSNQATLTEGEGSVDLLNKVAGFVKNLVE